MPTFGSLFAGIGGIDLGLERAGWTCRWQVEWDPFCQHVLAHHWPDILRYGDIAAVDWAAVERVDLIAGGFPCQPVSIAGKQAGQDDDRWLWPEFARAVRELRPRLVLVENVRNLLAVNGGGPFGEVLGDLATLGYDAEWDCIPAAAVGAPHLRDRVWIVGVRRCELGPLERVPDPIRDAVWIERERIEASERANGASPESGRDGSPRDVADAWGGGREVAKHAEDSSESSGAGQADQPARRRDPERDVANPNGAGLSLSRPQSDGTDRWIPGRGIAAGGWWTTEPDVGRVAHGVPARVDRLRALGNAVVPQVVEMIGRRLADYLGGAA